MHTVELLEEAIQVAQQLNVEVRNEWLGGDGSGHCLVRGRKLILLDLAQMPDEHFAAVRDALRGERRLSHIEMTPELAEQLDVRSIA